MKSVLTAFRLILQTIAVWIYPAFLAAGLLECITMGDQMCLRPSSLDRSL
jgi:hypothetical protein